MDKKFYTVSQFAEQIGVNPATLRRWDNNGTLPALRTPTNQRVYTQEQLDDYMTKLRSGFPTKVMVKKVEKKEG